MKFIDSMKPAEAWIDGYHHGLDNGQILKEENVKRELRHLEALVMNAEFDRDAIYRKICTDMEKAHRDYNLLRKELDESREAGRKAQRRYDEERIAHQFTRGELAERTRERDDFKIRANDKDTECIDLMRDLEETRRNLRQVKNDKTYNDEYRLEIETRLRRQLIETEKERDALRANLEGKATERCLFIEGYDCSPENVREWIKNARAEFTRGHEQGWDDAKAEDKRLLQAVATDIKSAMEEVLA